MKESILMKELEKELEMESEAEDLTWGDMSRISTKDSFLLNAVGSDVSGDIVHLFETVKTDSAAKGVELVKLRGMIHRSARSIEMRMLDVRKISGIEGFVHHSFGHKQLEDLVCLLRSPNREDDNETLSESARALKESASKEASRKQTVYENGGCEIHEVVLSEMTESFASLICTIIEIEGWIIDTKMRVKEEVRVMAESLGLRM